jgi:hypothetical protein
MPASGVSATQSAKRATHTLLRDRKPSIGTVISSVWLYPHRPGTLFLMKDQSRDFECQRPLAYALSSREIKPPFF